MFCVDLWVTYHTTRLGRLIHFWWSGHNKWPLSKCKIHNMWLRTFHTLSGCKPPALVLFITYMKAKADEMYFLTIAVMCLLSPIPGLSTMYTPPWNIWNHIHAFYHHVWHIKIYISTSWTRFWPVPNFIRFGLSCLYKQYIESIISKIEHTCVLISHTDL